MCDSDACVDGTRICVRYLVEAWLGGEMERIINENERGITQAYFDPAILYACENPDELQWQAIEMVFFLFCEKNCGLLLPQASFLFIPLLGKKKVFY